MDSVGARARRRGDERVREREMGDDDDDDDDDAIGDARSAVWDGALLVTRDDVFKRFDDETRRTTIDADAELAEIFARDSTSTSTSTATARDGAHLADELVVDAVAGLGEEADLGQNGQI